MTLHFGLELRWRPYYHCMVRSLSIWTDTRTLLRVVCLLSCCHSTLDHGSTQHSTTDQDQELPTLTYDLATWQLQHFCHGHPSGQARFGSQLLRSEEMFPFSLLIIRWKYGEPKSICKWLTVHIFNHEHFGRSRSRSSHSQWINDVCPIIEEGERRTIAGSGPLSPQ